MITDAELDDSDHFQPPEIRDSLLRTHTMVCA